jgi:hypothetical protein
MVIPPGSLVASRVLRLQRGGVDVKHGRQLDQLRLVLVGVVLAEEEFGAGWQLGAYTGGSAAPVAPINPG